MAKTHHISIDQGADFSHLFDVNYLLDYDEDMPFDLTGYSSNAMMRKHFTSTNATSFTVSLNANDVTATISLTAAQTANITSGRYMYDVKLTSTANAVVRLVDVS